MTDQHFAMAQYLVGSRPWDFFMMVEIGVDRIHHAFWKFHDHAHRKYEPGNRFEHAIRDYYRYVDQKIAELLPALGEDTTILVVSDHGAKQMDGGVCVNEWLMREGYLALAEPVSGPTPISKAKIDWANTRVWGEGGYYSRIFMNVKGREPQGLICEADYEPLRDELKAKLEAMVDDQGRPLGNKVFKPQDVYNTVRGIPPDLIVYFGSLYWRSVGSLGWGSVYTFENDTGPDDANHAEYGIVMMRERNGGRRGLMEGARIFDVSATILDRFGLLVPEDTHGRPLPLN
jgi:predicted AlkP superfamily phosphohydrolase/phosphomutase